MQFTDRYIFNLKPKGKQYVKREARGFAVRVLPTGQKTFLFIYTFDGRRRQMNLGSYPEKSLSDARSDHAAAFAALNDPANPRDPQAERDQKQEAERLAREERRLAPTVEELAAEYMEKHAKPNKKTWRRDDLCLKNDVLPALGALKARDVRKRDMVLLLEGIVKRGAPGQAQNVLEVTRRMFTFAVERDILETSPMFGVKSLTKKAAKDRVLTSDEVKALWFGLTTAAISNEIARALKLILVTGARPGEVIGIHTDEIRGDWWEIPAERSKNGCVHRVFLTSTAKELIGEKKGYIFESPRGLVLNTGEIVAKPMDVNALAYALRRNLKGYKRQRAARNGSDSDAPSMVPVREDKKMDIAPFTPHDLRRTAATNLSELGFSDEVIDAILNHVKKGVIATYNRYKYDKEKQKALGVWERKLLGITTGAKGAKVLPMARKV